MKRDSRIGCVVVPRQLTNLNCCQSALLPLHTAQQHTAQSRQPTYGLSQVQQPYLKMTSLYCVINSHERGRISSVTAVASQHQHCYGNAHCRAVAVATCVVVLSTTSNQEVTHAGQEAASWQAAPAAPCSSNAPHPDNVGGACSKVTTEPGWHLSAAVEQQLSKPCLHDCNAGTTQHKHIHAPGHNTAVLPAACLQPEPSAPLKYCSRRPPYKVMPLPQLKTCMHCCKSPIPPQCSGVPCCAITSAVLGTYTCTRATCEWVVPASQGC